MIIIPYPGESEMNVGSADKETDAEAQELLLELLIDDTALERDDGLNISAEDAWQDDADDDFDSGQGASTHIIPPRAIAPSLHGPRPEHSMTYHNVFGRITKMTGAQKCVGMTSVFE
eukprot:3350893-Karenia_brevis.AAC.1